MSAEAEVRDRALRAFLSTAPILLWSIDRRGTITLSSGGGLDAFGLREGEHVGQSVFELYAELPVVAESHRRALAGENVRYETTVRNIHLDCWLNPLRDASGDVVGAIGMATNVSGRVGAEQRLERSEGLFETLLESAPHGVMVSDSEGRMVLVNRRTESFFGYSREELLGQPVELLVPARAKEGHPGHRMRFSASPSTRPMGIGQEISGLRKDGTEFPAVVTLSATQTAEGALFMALIADVTESRKLEDQLHQSQRLETIGQLAAGVAHDFNNLLTSVLTNAEFLRSGMGAGDSMLGQVEEIRDAATRAAALTKQLLAFGRRQVLQPGVLDINRVVVGLEPMLRRLISEDIRLVTSLDPAIGPTKVDPTKLEQVIVNLTVNARDAMPDGGSIMIETANVELDETYVSEHVGAHAGPHVVLAVTDTGVGMDPATTRKVFEPFFTTKPRGKGTGMGLATVYGIVKQTGGNIWVYSELGKGTTFKIYLPRAAGAARADIGRAGRSDDVSAEPVSSGSETILLAEDDAAVRRAARQILQRLGYTVLDAETPSKALDILRTHEGHIHLLMTDMVMPEMSGTELAESASRVRTGIKVLYVSGYAENAIQTPRVLQEGSAFLEKPFTYNELAKKVRETLDASG